MSKPNSNLLPFYNQNIEQMDEMNKTRNRFPEKNYTKYLKFYLENTHDMKISFDTIGKVLREYNFG